MLKNLFGNSSTAFEQMLRESFYAQSPTLLDYGEVLLSLHPLERRTTHLFSYICELSLLYSALATPPPAKLACAVLLLTRALHHYGNNTH